MVDLATLSPSERARQLGNPEGEVGVELGLRLNKVNNKITDHVYARLGLDAGMNVLEIGFGNGHLLPDLLRQSDGWNIWALIFRRPWSTKRGNSMRLKLQADTLRFISRLRRIFRVMPPGLTVSSL